MFIIPGFKESVKDVDYKSLRKFFEGKNYEVKLVPVIWNYKTMSDYLQQFEDFYMKHKTSVNHVLGFSYGAVIAFSSAQKLGVQRLYLCSLSPDFSEDVIDMQEWVTKYIGSRRLKDCLGRSGRELAQQLTVPTTILYGEKEALDFPKIKTRALETKELAKNVKVIEVKEAPHDIFFPAYREAIEKLF